MGGEYPLIRLDRTLSELYALDGGDAREGAQLIGLPSPRGQVAEALPANRKYVFHTPTAPSIAPSTYARIALGSGAQNHGFISGAACPLYLFDLDPPAFDKASGRIANPPLHVVDAERTYAALVPEQRPQPTFIRDAAAFRPGPGEAINPYPTLDFLDAHPTILSQETLYQFQSKRWLALSGLPTPPTRVVDLDPAFGPADARDAAKVQAEAQRLVAESGVRDRALPFVVKFPQTYAGAGVFVLKDEAARTQCLAVLETAVPAMLEQLTEENAALQPAALLVQDWVDGAHRSACFFVSKRSGQVVTLSTTEPFLDAAGHWCGSVLDYERQEALEADFASTVATVAARLHSEGYYGCVGADMIVDGATGAQYVVDLNVRLVGSCMMGPLKGHLYDRRALRYSYILTPLVMLGSRDDFEAKFDAELREARIVIVGWARDKNPGGLDFTYSVCALVVAGKTQPELMQLIGKIRKNCISE